MNKIEELKAAIEKVDEEIKELDVDIKTLKEERKKLETKREKLQAKLKAKIETDTKSAQAREASDPEKLMDNSVMSEEPKDEKQLCNELESIAEKLNKILDQNIPSWEFSGAILQLRDKIVDMIHKRRQHEPDKIDL